MKVLVTDGSNKNTLAILRAIGKKHWIGITSSVSKITTLNSYSRYCKNTHLLQPDPKSLEQYSEELQNILKTYKYDMLIPVGLQSCLCVSKYKQDFQQLTKTMIADWPKMQIAYSRDLAIDFAKKIGVPTPSTNSINAIHDINDLNTYPVVIKTIEESGTHLRYCNSKDEVSDFYAFLKKLGLSNIISQEYIGGFGCGFYGVYHEGQLITYIMQKRIKEFPITGGSAAVAETFDDAKLATYGKKLCDALEWNGPIMIEFKYDSAVDDYKLLEINPKLWGSLDLAIAAGMNVPDILIKLANGHPVEHFNFYSKVKYRWIFPDEFRYTMAGCSWLKLKDFLRLEKNVKNNINIHDPLPTLIQIIRGLKDGIMLFFDKKRRFPHNKANYVSLG